MLATLAGPRHRQPHRIRETSIDVRPKRIRCRAYSKSTGYAKFLLMTIASHLYYKAAYAYPSLDTLARETTLSKPTVIKLIAVLIALGELEVIRGHGRGHTTATG